jgi:hypothetical protein
MTTQLTWTCHVCGETRSDDKISVQSKTVEVNGIVIKQNVRYCNDRPACIEGAKNVDWLGGPAHYEMTKDE